MQSFIHTEPYIYPPAGSAIAPGHSSAIPVRRLGPKYSLLSTNFGYPEFWVPYLSCHRPDF